MTDFKQLCADLLSDIDDDISYRAHVNSCASPDALRFSKTVLRARAALNEPDQVAPMDKELAELYRKSYYECKNRQGDAAQVFALRAVLARWGK